MRKTLFATIALGLMVACDLGGGTSEFIGRVVAKADGATPTCATATSDGDICAGDAIEANGALDVAGTSTLTGAVTLGAGLTFAGDLTLENAEIIDNGADGKVGITGAGGTNNEGLIWDFETTANAVEITSGTGVLEVDYNTVNLACGALDVSDGAITNVSDIGLDSITPDATNVSVTIGAGELGIGDGTYAAGHSANVLIEGVLEVDSASFFDNTLTIEPPANTTSGTDDYVVNLAQTLNDSAAGGTDTFRGIKLDVTNTDSSGWDVSNLLDLMVDAASIFHVTLGGDVILTDDSKGATIAIKFREETVTFAGGGEAAKATTGTMIEDGDFVIGVTSRVVTTATTCTSADIGINGVDVDCFSDGGAVAAGTTTDNSNGNATDACIVYPARADHEIEVLAVGGNCVNGVWRIKVHYLDVVADTAN